MRCARDIAGNVPGERGHKCEGKCLNKREYARRLESWSRGQFVPINIRRGER